MSPRAVGGRRLAFEEIPEPVRAWVGRKVGQVHVLAEHVGGMSPGCAVSLASSGGGTVFLKAVGEELNPRTLEIFRAEAAVLPLLAPVDYRPRFLGCHDEAGWVAILLEHVEGRYPDIDDPADFAALDLAVQRQSAELTPPPDGLPRDQLMADNARRWQLRWEGPIVEDPGRFLPTWAVERMPELLDRVAATPGQLPEDALCHCDGRDDNTLIRADGTAVVLDWGMWQLGPTWLDRALLAAQLSDGELATQWLASWVPPQHDDAVTNLFLSFGGSQAWRASQPADPSLPAMQDYCREDSRRFLELARLRLGA